MKKENLTKGEGLLFNYQNKVYTIDVKKLLTVLKKFGFDQSEFEDISGITKFLEENKLMNREFIEFISS